MVATAFARDAQLVRDNPSTILSLLKDFLWLMLLLAVSTVDDTLNQRKQSDNDMIEWLSTLSADKSFFSPESSPSTNTTVALSD